ncbi:MAG TPA: hypothetical protein EYN66_09305 [Myxococcales bacterium]|nr:hypothetical protein [Myxococcales bacterium]
MKKFHALRAIVIVAVLIVSGCSDPAESNLSLTTSGSSDSTGGSDDSGDVQEVDLDQPIDSDQTSNDSLPLDDLNSGGVDTTPESDVQTPPTDVESSETNIMVICTPGEDKGECGSPSEFYRCSNDGLAWNMIKCNDPPFCYEGQCKNLQCPPGETMCVNPKLLRTCEEVEPGTYDWVDTNTCEDGICKNGKCVGGCSFNMKLNKGENCLHWQADFTPEAGESCNSDSLLVVPSSKDNRLAVFDISVNPPVALEGSPFVTCKNPSRILMDSNTDVVASCRSDGKIQKHHSDGSLVWSTQLTGCSGARGVTLNGEGRLFGGCSSNGKVYELDPDDGTIMSETLVGGYIYGLTAEPTGLYVAQFSAIFGGANGATNKGVTKLSLGGANDLEKEWQTAAAIYGFALDGAGSLWLGGNNQVRALDTDTGLQIDSYTIPSYAHGIAVGLDGNVYAGMGGKHQVARITPGGGPVELLTLPAGSHHPRGVALDAESNVYTINMNSSNITRFDGVTNTATSFGEGSLANPYGYSGDMTGLTSSCLVNTTSSWKTPVHDTLTVDTMWGAVKWSSNEPPGTSIKVYYRIDNKPWTTIQNTQSIDQIGQKVQLKATMVTEVPEVVATLKWIGVTYTQ